MAFKNPFENVFRTIAGQFAKAGKTFETYRHKLSEIGFPFLINREIERFREYRRAARNRDVISRFSPGRTLPATVTTETTRRLSREWQYLFEVGWKTTIGVEVEGRMMSILSNERLTPEQATRKMRRVMRATIQESVGDLSEITQVDLVEEIHRSAI